MISEVLHGGRKGSSSSSSSISVILKELTIKFVLRYQTMILTSKLTGIASERGMEWGRLAAYASYMLKRKGSEPDKELVKLEMSLIKNGMRKQTATKLGRTALAAFNSGQVSLGVTALLWR